MSFSCTEYLKPSYLPTDLVISTLTAIKRTAANCVLSIIFALLLFQVDVCNSVRVIWLTGNGEVGSYYSSLLGLYEVIADMISRLLTYIPYRTWRSLKILLTFHNLERYTNELSHTAPCLKLYCSLLSSQIRPATAVQLLLVLKSCWERCCFV